MLLQYPNGSGILAPGGDGGFTPWKGLFNFTVRTDEMSLAVYSTKQVPSVVLTSPQTIYAFENAKQKTLTVYVRAEFLEPPPSSFIFAANQISAGNEAKVDESSVKNEGYDPDISRHIISANFILREGASQIQVLAGASNQTSNVLTLIASHFVEQASWGPLKQLRDPSGMFPDKFGEKASDGWFVTPIHANVVAQGKDYGKILVSGWLRRDGLPCKGGNGYGGRRAAAVTFLLDPSDLQSRGTQDVAIQRIEEGGEYSFEDIQNGRIEPTQDGHPLSGDSIYCAGHTTLVDGRIFFAGVSFFSLNFTFKP